MNDHTGSAFFGAEEAEFDAALEDTFVTTSDVRLILSARKSIVRGPKGSGKSALYSFLVKNTEQEIPSDRRMFAHFGRHKYAGLPISRTTEWFTRDRQKIKQADEHVISAMWQALLGIFIVDYINKRKNSLPRGVIDSCRSACVSAGLSKNIIGKLFSGSRDFVTTLLSMVSITIGGDGSFQVQILASDSTTSSEAATFSHALLLDRLDDALAQAEVHLAMCIDNIDELYPYDFSTQNKLLRGLFLAYRELRTQKHLSMIVFIRSDVFFDLELKQIDKIEALILDVAWELPEVLDLLHRRLVSTQEVAAYLNQKGVDTASMSEVFHHALPFCTDAASIQQADRWLSENLKNSQGAIYPRYVIQLLNQAGLVNVSHPDSASFFEVRALDSALRYLSGILVATLVNDYRVSRQVVDIIEGKGSSSFRFEDIFQYFPKEEAPFLSSQLTILERTGYLARSVSYPTGRETRFEDYLIYSVPAIFRHHWKRNGQQDAAPDAG